MTNVLPLPAQKSLWRMHIARFLIVLSLMLIALALMAMLALIPSFVALEANTISPEEQNAEAASATENLKNMTTSQTLLLAVAPIMTSTSSPSAAIELALSLKPKGVTVRHIRYAATTKTIQLGGSATRDSLTAYRTALEGAGVFTSVSVPVAALVGASGQYSITLGGQF